MGMALSIPQFLPRLSPGPTLIWGRVQSNDNECALIAQTNAYITQLGMRFFCKIILILTFRNMNLVQLKNFDVRRRCLYLYVRTPTSCKRLVMVRCSRFDRPLDPEKIRCGVRRNRSHHRWNIVANLVLQASGPIGY